MPKPIITNRVTQGTALTYAQLDTNFSNLQDATFTLKAGTGGTDVVSDLNGTVTLVAGSGVTLTGNNTAKTVTIATSETQNIFVNVVAGGTTLVADTTTDSLTLTGGTGISVTGNATTDTATFALANTAVTAGSYTNANITVDAQGRITAAANGTGGGGIASGTTGQIPYYASNGTSLTALPSLTVSASAGQVTLNASGGIVIESGTGSNRAWLLAQGSSDTYINIPSAKKLNLTGTIQSGSYINSDFPIKTGPLATLLRDTLTTTWGASATTGMIIFNSTTSTLQYHNGTTWVDMSSSGSGVVSQLETSYNSGSGIVSIKASTGNVLVIGSTVSNTGSAVLIPGGLAVSGTGSVSTSNGRITSTQTTPDVTWSGGYSVVVNASATTTITASSMYAGLLLINNQSSNSTALYLVQGASIVTVSSSGTNLGTVSYSSGVGYRWTNPTASLVGLRVMSFMVQAI